MGLDNKKKKNIAGEANKTNNTENELAELLGKCFDDGEKQMVSNVKQGQEKSNSHEPLVSIRCRRHKRRFEVPKSWTDTCAWLCPKCYHKLTAEEREHYAPKTEAHIRQVEPKVKPPTLNPSPKSTDSFVELDCFGCNLRQSVAKSYFINEHFFCPDCQKTLRKAQRNRYLHFVFQTQRERYDAAEKHFRDILHVENQSSNKPQGIPTASVQPIKPAPSKPLKQTVVKIQEPQIETIVEPLPISMPAELLPHYRITCRKCGETVPCHKSWFDTSVVLCPSCYSSMPKGDLIAFERKHPRSEAKLYEVKFSSAISSSHYTPQKPIRAPRCWATEVNACSEYFITTANKYKLMRAVREGRLSRVRARIELARRNKADYYNDMPSVDIPIVQR